MLYMQTKVIKFGFVKIHQIAAAKLNSMPFFPQYSSDWYMIDYLPMCGRIKEVAREIS